MSAMTETVELVDAYELDIRDLWHEWMRTNRYTVRAAIDFVDSLKARVNDPDELDELLTCTECGVFDWPDNVFTVQSGDVVCEPCREYNYRECNCCNEWVRAGYTYYALNDDRICESCLSNRYSFCDYCDGYYPNDQYDEHTHDEGAGCCEAPAQSFTVRNDGCEPLANDERVTITLPAGQIDNEGLDCIWRYLRNYGYNDAEDYSKYVSLTYALRDGAIGNQWQTKEGNFTKRLSRYAYKELALKLPQEVISQVGNIASEHSRAVDFAIEVTRDLNQSAADFYHEDSCWWGSYYASRCTLKSNGGYGIRSFNEHGVSGRAWSLPLRLTESGSLVPTFDTMTPNAFVVFNGYGALSGYTPARIVAHMAGWTYRKIDFRMSHNPDIYVNGGSAYLIAPEDIASQYTDGALYLNLTQHSDLYESEHANASV